MHFPGMPLPLAHRLRQRVEEAGERAAGLGLDVDGDCDVLEIVRSDPPAHRVDRLVERKPEPFFAEHARELLGGGSCAVVGDRPQSRPQAMARAKRGRGRDGREHVRQLPVEGLCVAMGDDSKSDERRGEAGKHEQ